MSVYPYSMTSETHMLLYDMAFIQLLTTWSMQLNWLLMAAWYKLAVPGHAEQMSITAKWEKGYLINLCMDAHVAIIVW